MCAWGAMPIVPHASRGAWVQVFKTVASIQLSPAGTIGGQPLRPLCKGQSVQHILVQAHVALHDVGHLCGHRPLVVQQFCITESIRKLYRFVFHANLLNLASHGHVS
mmetsp:Transcript_98005/g.193991  ORF Transcript_98005/g.193991 Transcript_98005/m.193991 type:complete len:107 (-) Transcript_98005:70-390(-)